MNKVFWIVIILIIVGSGFYYYGKNGPAKIISSYEECVTAGNPILETYPEQCKTPAGQTFTRIIPDIETTNPRPTNPPDTTRVRGPEDVILAIGQSGSVAGLTVKVLDVQSDNRCPIDVQCIQAGKAVVAVMLDAGSGTQTLSFDYPGTYRTFAGYNVSVINVTPVPNTKSGPIKKADYLITLHVTPTAVGENL